MINPCHSMIPARPAHIVPFRPAFPYTDLPIPSLEATLRCLRSSSSFRIETTARERSAMVIACLDERLAPEEEEGVGEEGEL